MTERIPLPKKKPTRREQYPIPGFCDCVSARGLHCSLGAGHEKTQPLHRRGRTTWVEVIDLTFDPRIRRGAQ